MCNVYLIRLRQVIYCRLWFIFSSFGRITNFNVLISELGNTMNEFRAISCTKLAYRASDSLQQGD